MTQLTKFHVLIAFLFAATASVWVFPESSLAATLDFKRPVSGKAALRFGDRYTNQAGLRRTHHGLDIEAQAGDRVWASAGGTVLFAGSTPLGLCVSIVHANGVKTTYLPLSHVYVKKGDKLAAASAIGTVAPSGDVSSSISHLHMGAVFAGEYIDPESLFSGGFRADLSRLIRRGNIPPGQAVVSAKPKNGSATYLDDFLAAGTGAFNLFYGGFIGFGQFVYDFGWSAVNTGSRLARTAGRLVGFPSYKGKSFYSSFFPEYTRAYINWLKVGFIGDFGAPGRVRLFDPSGDSAGPQNRLYIETGNESPAAAVDILDETGILVRHISGWELPYGGILWTGDSNSGAIVANGYYRLVAKRLDRSTSAYLAEVRWHLE